MKESYFIVVLAHSFHGRLRRLHIPHQAIYAVLALAAIGLFTAVGVIASYGRMALKVANYNSLQGQFHTLQERYQNLQQSATQTNQQLATLQTFATEVSMAYGMKRQLEGAPDISAEAPLLPSFNQTIAEYNFLKTSSRTHGFSRRPRPWMINVKPSLWPVQGRLLSPFGRRNDPFSGESGDMHPGVDLSSPVGTPVKVAADGVVVHAEFSGGYGRLIVVDHGEGLQTYYAHLSRMDVIPGQEVRRGQIVAATGASGRVTAPHLHYEVRQGGTPVNPYSYLKTSIGNTTARDLPF
jgi:murein DD-endopeptidase MepM/ murein hydrolase activator NlpD